MSNMTCLDTTDRAEAVRMAPWAEYVVRSSVGFIAFADLDAFQHWMRRRNFVAV